MEDAQDGTQWGRPLDQTTHTHTQLIHLNDSARIWDRNGMAMAIVVVQSL